MSHPISASPEAVALISERLRYADGDPGLIGYIPNLFRGRDLSSTKDGRVVYRIASEFFDVGWQKPEITATDKYAEIDLGGVTMIATTDAIKGLEGKTLVLKVESVGVPTPTDVTARVLRAV